MVELLEDACPEKIADELGKREVVILDFWSEGCVPCKAVESTLRRIAARYSGDNRVKVLRVNVGDYPELAADYGVLSLPTVIVLHRGREVARFTGVVAGLYNKILNVISGLLM